MLTIPFIAFATALALIAVGLLGGGIEVKEIRIPQLPIIPRAACIVFGCILLGLLLFDRKLFDQLQEATATTTAPAPATPATPAPKHELGAAINRHLVEVHDVKRVLQHVGMYTGPVNDEADDGYFQAVANFQRSRSAFEDGLVGGETFGKLRDAWPEYFGILSASPAPTPQPNVASNTLSPTTSPAPPPPQPKPPEPKIYLQAALIYPHAFRILYVKEQKDFADRLRNYLASKGYKTDTVYDDFSEITQDSRAKPGTIRIVYKSTVEVFEPTLSGFMRDRFPSETGRLVKSLNDSAASDLQIQLW